AEFGRCLEARAAQAGTLQGDDGWPAPDMSLAESYALAPPPWPGNLFPGDWGDFIAQSAEARGCPPDFVGLGLLAAIASRLGNARWGSPWPGWREPPVIWCAVVGLPSAGKSGGLDEAADALATIEAGCNEDWTERQRDYRTQRQAAKERRLAWEQDVAEAVRRGLAPPTEPEGAQEPEPPARRRIFSTDPTIEKAGRLSAENPRGMLLLRDELAGWIGGMDRYGSGNGADRAFWLQAYGGRPWVPDRVKDGAAGVTVAHLAWAILGGIQPDRAASLMLAGDDDGLAARFLYAWPAARKPTRPSKPPPAGRLTDALQRIEALPGEPPEPVVLPFTPAAAAMMQDWREEAARIEGEASGLLLSWIGKLPGFALRLAVVSAHLDWLARPDGTPPPSAVDADAVARACGFLSDYALPMARRLFGEAALPEAERDARRLARWYLRQRPRPTALNAKALRRMAHGPGIGNSSRIEAALTELEAGGWCRPAPARAGDQAGRPRKDWAMHPALRSAGP
ncbi:MAG: DUF3987 domain-containing protein, partial [Alphaproteobacteria bacterium]|nr:DUF3987 domain-containing protein [Alphaproteobacteria bacterium]